MINLLKGCIREEDGRVGEGEAKEGVNKNFDVYAWYAAKVHKLLISETFIHKYI